MKDKTDFHGRNTWVLAGIFLLLVLLGWRVIGQGIGNSFSQLALSRADTQDNLRSALSWSPDNPVTLYKASMALSNVEIPRKRKLLERALAANPADGRVAASLALTLLASGEFSKGDELIRQAVSLLPDDVNTVVQAGEYWWQRGDQRQAVNLWSRAMERNSSYRKILFPLFLNLVERADRIDALAPVMRQVPSWWPAFFQYAADNATQARTLQSLYGLRLDADLPPSSEDYRTYLNYLEGERRWSEAFIVWANSLGPDKLGMLGQPVNGGFEFDISSIGFDWRIIEDPRVLIATDYTFGISGQRALRLAFRGEPMDFAHIQQRLFLHPQRYRFSGRVRPDSLQAGAGLQWVVSCSDSTGDKVLANSDRFLGIDQWRRFSFQFRVPESCPGQLIKLVAVKDGESKTANSGEIWFDDLSIERI